MWLLSWRSVNSKRRWGLRISCGVHRMNSSYSSSRLVDELICSKWPPVEWCSTLRVSNNICSQTKQAFMEPLFYPQPWGHKALEIDLYQPSENKNIITFSSAIGHPWIRMWTHLMRRWRRQEERAPVEWGLEDCQTLLCDQRPARSRSIWEQLMTEGHMEQARLGGKEAHGYGYCVI